MMTKNRKIIELDGGFNYRDLGGIENREGKQLRFGRLIRADEMGKLTNADLEKLTQLQLKTVVDFRDRKEINNNPDRMPGTVETYHPFHINPGNLEEVKGAYIDDLTESASTRIMGRLYQLLITDASCREQYRRFFSLLQNEENLPLLYHCTAGKDRTGVATMLILEALEVDRASIMEDYLLSNQYLEPKYGQFREKNAFFNAIFSVSPLYLEIAFKMMDEHFGSSICFLEDILHVDIKKMKQLYLN